MIKSGHKLYCHTTVGMVDTKRGKVVYEAHTKGQYYDVLFVRYYGGQLVKLHVLTSRGISHEMSVGYCSRHFNIGMVSSSPIKKFIL